jgi:hypothetical protein
MTSCHWCHDPLAEHDTTIDDTGRTVYVCSSTTAPADRATALAYIASTREHIRNRHDGTVDDRCPLCRS